MTFQGRLHTSSTEWEAGLDKSPNTHAMKSAVPSYAKPPFDMKEQRAQHKRGESTSEPMEISEETLCEKAVETYDIFVQLGRLLLANFLSYISAKFKLSSYGLLTLIHMKSCFVLSLVKFGDWHSSICNEKQQLKRIRSVGHEQKKGEGVGFCSPLTRVVATPCYRAPEVSLCMDTYDIYIYTGMYI